MAETEDIHDIGERVRGDASLRRIGYDMVRHLDGSPHKHGIERGSLCLKSESSGVLDREGVNGEEGYWSPLVTQWT